MRYSVLKMKSLSFLALLTIVSCSGGEVKRNLDEIPYRTSGVEQYFLPELPNWANHSPGGQCFKSSSFQYVDFSKVGSAYQLTYSELVELQGQYNERREEYFRSTSQRFLKPVEESSFFSIAVEQVKGGIRLFKIPNGSEVDVIWVEGFIQTNKVSELKAMVKKGRFDERLTILFSSCFSHQRLNVWMADNNLSDAGFYALSAEWLSPFDPDLSLKAGLHLNMTKLLNPGVKVRLVKPDTTLTPTELTY